MTRSIDEMLQTLNAFPAHTDARQATAEIQTAIDRATQQIAELQSAQRQHAAERATMATAAFLAGTPIPDTPDPTQGKIDTLNHVVHGLRIQLEKSKVAAADAMMEDLRIHAALLKQECDPAVERANILLSELRELAPRLRFLNERARQTESMWQNKGFPMPPPPCGCVPADLQGIRL